MTNETINEQITTTSTKPSKQKTRRKTSKPAKTSTKTYTKTSDNSKHYRSLRDVTIPSDEFVIIRRVAEKKGVTLREYFRKLVSDHVDEIFTEGIKE